MCVKFGDPLLKPFSRNSTEAVGGCIVDCFFFRYNCRPEVDNDVIFGVAVEYVEMDGKLKFGDSRSNSS